MTALLLQAAAASGARSEETRTLSLYFGHTGEAITVTYKRNGRFDPAALARLNAFLRDWRREQETSMDPQLFDLLWQVQQETGSRAPIHIISAFRSPETNSALRSRGRGVAKFSQHTRGKAIDFYLPDVPLAKIREVGLKLHAGGVGFYPTSGSPFVHLDTGSVRHWPRLTREQLVRIFPDGKTLHIPKDGKPLPGYQLAAAEQAKRNAGVQVAAAGGGSGRNIFGFLFGGPDKGDDDQEDRNLAARPPVPVRTPSPPSEVRTPSPPSQIAAIAPPKPRPVARSQDDPLAALIAREKRESAARAMALASLAPPSPRPSIAAAAPPVLLNLGPVDAPQQRNEAWLVFAAGRVAANPMLSGLKGGNAGDLYTVPRSTVVFRFTRYGNLPARTDRFEGPTVVSLPVRIFEH